MDTNSSISFLKPVSSQRLFLTRSLRANEALSDLRTGRLQGAAVLVP